MIRNGTRVSPRSAADIEKFALLIRQECFIDDRNCVPILAIIEAFLSEGFEVGEMGEMGDNEGLTYPDLGIIKIREDVYEAAIQNNGRARFTCAHELGHYLLHQNVSFARNNMQQKVIHAYENSEWQADQFAGIFLAPTHIIAGLSTAKEIAACCKISLKAAEIRLRKSKN